MYNLLQEKGFSILKTCHKMPESITGRNMYSKGLKFIAEMKRMESDELNTMMIKIMHSELFPIKQNFTLNVDIHLKSCCNKWETISSSKHVFNESKKFVELNIPNNIIKSVNSNDEECHTWKISVACEENLYEQWNFLQLTALVKKLKKDYGYSLRPEKVSDVIEMLWKDRICTDFMFKVSGKEFKVHKNILAAQSKVFKRMFNGNEKSMNFINVTDVSAEAIQEFLEYLYIKQIPAHSKHTIDLYNLAHKYAIKNLLIVCELLIMENIRCVNAIEYLEFANAYNMELVKLLAFERTKKFFPKQLLPANMKNHPKAISELIDSKAKLKNDLKSAVDNYRSMLIRACSKYSKDLNNAQNNYDKKFRTMTYQHGAKQYTDAGKVNTSFILSTIEKAQNGEPNTSHQNSEQKIHRYKSPLKKIEIEKASSDDDSIIEVEVLDYSREYMEIRRHLDDSDFIQLEDKIFLEQQNRK